MKSALRRFAWVCVALGVLATPGAGAPPAREADWIDGIPLGPSPGDRIEEIRRRVQAAVVYPEPARRRGISGTTRIQFVIDAGGRAQEVVTVESSGSRLLDRAAEQSPVTASPLPHVYGRLQIPIVFELRTP